MALPVVASFASASSGGTPVNSITINKPTGVVSGDLLLIIAGSDDNGSSPDFSDISGFTKFVNIGTDLNDSKIGCYWRIADGTEGVDIDVAHDPVEDLDEMYGWYIRVTGADGTTPINVTGIAANLNARASHVIPEVTTTVNDCLAFYVHSHDGGDGAPFSVSGTGWSESDEQQSGTGSNDASGCWGTKGQATAGLTGDATVASTGSDGSTNIQFAVAPSGVSDTPITPPVGSGIFSGVAGTMDLGIKPDTFIRGTKG